MKDLLTASLVLLTATGAAAQYVLPSQSVFVTAQGHRANHDRSYTINTTDPITGDQIWYTAASGLGIMIGTGGNLWENGGVSGLTEYNTISGGATDLMRTDGPSHVTIGIYHNINGMIYAVNGVASANTTDIISEDDITIQAMSQSTVYSSAATDAIMIDGSSGSFNLFEGQYLGGTGYSGGYFRSISSLEIYGSAFVAGNFSDIYTTRSPEGQTVTTASGNSMSYAASGLFVNSMSGALIISNRTNVASDRFEAAEFSSLETSEENTYLSSAHNSTPSRWMIGGDGLTATAITGDTTIYGGTFTGSQQVSGTRTISFTEDYTTSADINTSGGNGASLSGAGDALISGGVFEGGDAGTGLAGGSDATVIANAGSGIYLSGKGAVSISNSEYYAGNAGRSSIQTGVIELSDAKSDANGTASAIGGNGIRIDSSGATTISNVVATGTQGGFAKGSLSANASGGAGIYLLSTETTINGGSFTGGNGGDAQGDGSSYAYGGAGVYASGDSLTINAGEFTGGNSGSATSDNNAGGIGVWTANADLTITEEAGDTLINGDIVFYNTTSNHMEITGGTISGNIIKYGEGLVTLSVDESATYTGSFELGEGDATVTIDDDSQGKFFSDVAIGTNSTMTFVGTNRLLTADDSQFALNGTASTLDFTQGAYLSEGTEINVGSGLVTASGNIEMGNNATISFSYLTSFDSNGVSSISGGSLTGDLVISNTTAKISAQGISAKANDVIQLTTGGVNTGTNSLTEVTDTDFGFLTKTEIADSGGIQVTLSYNSLTNTFTDLDTALLTHFDGLIQTNATEQEFYALNRGGEDQIRYAISQIPDTSESMFAISQQLNEQIAARGTEFRSMNGFASTQPKYESSPTGVAGPVNKLDKEKTTQGWIRAYGGSGDRDADGHFSEYDSTSFGTVIGIDKSFGNLLVGLAGGYARTDLDSDAYNADINTYHGSIYSTYGGESFFVDLALTYGRATTDEENDTSEASFDSSLYSAYIGAGYAFDIGEKISITPEVSLLMSSYSQEEYSRTIAVLGNGTVEDYDTSSFLGSIGVNLATQHQLDWLSRGIAFIPEVRVHYLHEFDADPDDFSYAIGGTTSPFSVRSRDEHLFRFGFGFDMWSWKHVNTKFEIDYDLLASDTYVEQIVSGKATWRF